MSFQFTYQEKDPYPAIRIEAQNRCYARAMLSNIGSCNSEMSAVSLYFYNSVVLKNCFAEVSEIFHKISIVEMHHLDIFATLACDLGADPRLISCDRSRPAYWSPSCNRYPDPIMPLLTNALHGEQDAVRKYREQLTWINDPCICACLKRIIRDEELHIRIFEELIRFFQSVPDPRN